MRFLLWAILIYGGSAFANLYGNGDIEWTRYSNGLVGDGFPKVASGDWADLGGLSSVDAAFKFSVNGRIYVFRGLEYYRLNAAGDQVDPGYPRTIGINGWLGGPTGNFDAVVEHPTNGFIYFFRDNRYYRFNVAQDQFEPGWRTIGVDGWFGVNWTGQGVDAGVYRPSVDKVYFFSGDEYVRYDLQTDAVDAGYPRKTAEYGWRGLRKSLNAAVHRGQDTIDFLHPAPPQRTITPVFNMTDYSAGGAGVPDAAIHDQVIAYLQAADVGSDVWLSVPGFDNVEVAQAIRAAYDRGVQVKLVSHRIATTEWFHMHPRVANVLFPPPGGGSGYNQQDPFYNNNWRVWRWGNEPGRVALGLNGLNHAKVYAFESTSIGSNISIVTSSNLRDRDRQRQNDAVVLESETVYAELSELVERLYLLAQNNTQASSEDWHRFGRTFEIDRDLEVYVVPPAIGGGSARDPHLDLLNDIMPDNNCEVFVAGSSWKYEGRGRLIADKLVDLKSAGCSVWVSGHDSGSAGYGVFNASQPFGQETQTEIFTLFSNASVPWSQSNTHSKYIAVNARLASRAGTMTKVVSGGALNFTWGIGPGAMVDVGFTAYDDDVFCDYKNNWFDLWLAAFKTDPVMAPFWVAFLRVCY